jgi:hypothetical protein
MRKKKRKKMSKNKIKNLEVQRKLFKQTIYNCKKGPAMEDTQTIKKEEDQGRPEITSRRDEYTLQYW